MVTALIATSPTGARFVNITVQGENSFDPLFSSPLRVSIRSVLETRIRSA